MIEEMDAASANEMISILMYLFKEHMHDSCELEQPIEEIITLLEKQGYSLSAIEQAFSWLASLQKMQDESMESTPTNEEAWRQYHDVELKTISQDGLSFLDELVKKKILTFTDRETVINLSLSLGLELVTLPILKWVTMMALFNKPDKKSKESLRYIETMILADMVTKEAN